jgi:hypothetical protein
MNGDFPVDVENCKVWWTFSLIFIEWQRERECVRQDT